MNVFKSVFGISLDPISLEIRLTEGRIKAYIAEGMKINKGGRATETYSFQNLLRLQLIA